MQSEKIERPLLNEFLDVVLEELQVEMIMQNKKAAEARDQANRKIQRFIKENYNRSNEPCN